MDHDHYLLRHRLVQAKCLMILRLAMLSRNMYIGYSQEHAWIEKTVIADINAMKKQMADRALQMGNTREKREWENEQKRAINDKYYYIQARIDDLNAAFSRQVGAPVDVMHIDWTKGPEQFHN